MLAVVVASMVVIAVTTVIAYNGNDDVTDVVTIIAVVALPLSPPCSCRSRC